MSPPDLDAVTAAVLACPPVAGMAGGRYGEVATYLPGRRLPGVRLGPDGLEVHVVARWGPALPDVADVVRLAVAPLADGLPVTVYIDDIQIVPAARRSPTLRPHEVLGVSPTADAREVTGAYRRFALRHHPDRGGDPERFAAGVEAYHRLMSRPAAARAEIVFHRRSRPGLAGLLRRARSHLVARSRS